MILRLTGCIKFKPIGEGEAKASLKRAIKVQLVDPKPGELGMARLKLP